jgi:hypothetical protein
MKSVVHGEGDCICSPRDLVHLVRVPEAGINPARAL